MEIELDILGELFLQDLVRAKELEQEFLSACYCGSGALSQYALVSKDILRTRYYETVNRKYQQVEEARGRAGVSRSLMDSMVDTGLSRRPVVLLGDVGVGKTTFIRHLVTVDAKRELETALVLYVDFGVQPALRQDLQQYVAEEFSVQLREQYGLDIYTDSFVRAVYNGEINRFRDGIYGSLRTSSPPDFQRHEIEMLAELTRQREAHLKRSLQHLRGSEQRSTVVFLDNIDQRPDEFQDEVYLIAHSMAESWHLPVFVTLRPTTFYRSKKSGSLSGYQPRVFTISPPRVDEVVLRRLKYASRLVFDEGLPISSQGITVDSETLRDYITVLIESIERNPELAECLDNVSAGNVRRALDLLSSFIGSGHVHTRKILQIYREKGRYLIPLHEFLRAVIYGDHEHYDPTASFVANAFDISTPSGKEHFITPVLLTYLVRQSAGTSADRGFVLLAELTRFLMALGFLESQIQFAVDRCALAGMLETSIDTDSDRPHGSERARVTQAGVYLIDRLLKQFVYVDAVIVDTPVLSADTRSQLGLSNHVDGRLRRARAFVAYLDEQWTTLADLDCGYDWPATSRAVLNDISSVEARLSRSGPRP